MKQLTQVSKIELAEASPGANLSALPHLADLLKSGA